MSERGKAQYAYISNTSNTVVATRPVSLYAIVGTFPAGALVRIDDAHRFSQGILDINAVSSNTVVAASSFPVTFTPGVSLNAGMAVAVSSNAKATLIYE